MSLYVLLETLNDEVDEEEAGLLISVVALCTGDVRVLLLWSSLSHI